MTPFLAQYMKCKEENMVGKGSLKELSLADVPFCPAKAQIFIKNKITHLGTTTCLRFGGECRSDKLQCKELRGILPTDLTK